MAAAAIEAGQGSRKDIEDISQSGKLGSTNREIAIRDGGRRRPGAADALLRGAIDAHHHGYPEISFDLRTRRDDVDELHLARDAGMAAIILRSHMWPTLALCDWPSNPARQTGVRVSGQVQVYLNSRDDVVLSKNRLDTSPNVSSSNPFILRQLTSDDLPLMEAMLTMFGEAFDDVETYSAARPDAAYLARLLGRDHFIALAVLKDTSVVGGLAAYELEKFEQARKEVYIYDLAVAASHRRQGVATALITAVRQIAAKRGAHVIFVQADHVDEPAVALYTKLGAREDVLHFDIAVE